MAMASGLYESTKRHSLDPSALDQTSGHLITPLSPSKQICRRSVIPTTMTQRNKIVRSRIWRPNKNLAGELDRCGAFDTVKETVVGEGRWILSRPGMVDMEEITTAPMLLTEKSHHGVFRCAQGLQEKLTANAALVHFG